jgi:hypothetical protein
VDLTGASARVTYGYPMELYPEFFFLGVYTGILILWMLIVLVCRLV